MYTSSSQFESRNVLDRFESTGITLVASESRLQYLFIFGGTLIGRWILGLLFLGILPLAAWIVESSGLFLWIITGGVLLIGMLLILGFVMGLSEVALYQAISWEREQDGERIIKKAWSKIGSWFAYIGWSALILGGGTLLGLGVWVSIFARELGLISSQGLAATNLTANSIGMGILITLGLLGGLIWFSTSVTPGKPQYILSGETGLRAYLELRHMSQGRWWRIFGNLLLAGLIVSLALGMITSFIPDNSGLWKVFALIGSSNADAELWGSATSNIIEHTITQTKLLKIIDSLDTGIGFWSFLTGILGLALSIVATGFLQAFNYVIGKDIVTPASRANDTL
jgi:hypothetical protein